MNIDDAEHEMIRMRDPNASVMHRKTPAPQENPYLKLWEQSQEIERLKTERSELMEQVENLGRFIGRPGMTAAHIVTETVSKIEKLEAECTRLHALWHSAEEMLNVEKADSLRSEMVKICAAITGHTPRELCTTAEAVEWLVERHKAATAAMLKLEEIRTDKLAQAGFSEEPTAISEARHILRHNARVVARRGEAPISVICLLGVATHDLFAKHVSGGSELRRTRKPRHATRAEAREECGVI